MQKILNPLSEGDFKKLLSSLSKVLKKDAIDESLEWPINEFVSLFKQDRRAAFIIHLAQFRRLASQSDHKADCELLKAQNRFIRKIFKRWVV